MVSCRDSWNGIAQQGPTCLGQPAAATTTHFWGRSSVWKAPMALDTYFLRRNRPARLLRASIAHLVMKFTTSSISVSMCRKAPAHEPPEDPIVYTSLVRSVAQSQTSCSWPQWSHTGKSMQPPGKNHGIGTTFSPTRTRNGTGAYWCKLRSFRHLITPKW